MDKFLLVYKCRNCGGRVTAWACRNPAMSIPQHLSLFSVDPVLQCLSHACPPNDNNVHFGVADLIGAREE